MRMRAPAASGWFRQTSACSAAQCRLLLFACLSAASLSSSSSVHTFGIVRAFVSPHVRLRGEPRAEKHTACFARRPHLLGERRRQSARLQMGGTEHDDAQGQARRLPQRLEELCTWVGSSQDGKEAGLRLVKLGDDFARAHGETLSPPLLETATKVHGCVSVVRIVVGMQDATARGGVVVRGQADARLARGMLALLADGLEGVSLEEVMSLDTETIIDTAKLRQFLPPGRNNGLANMLAVICEQAAAQAAAATAGAMSSGAAPFPNPPQGNEQVVLATSAAVNARADITSASDASQVWAWGGRAEEVAMLLSGGVDSSVAMALLKQQGFKVTTFRL